MNKEGVLLVNLGTPEAPTVEKVKPYLKEFLMDPLVIDIPYLFRWFLVNVIILPRRPRLSAEAYKKVWTQKGSPLLTHTLHLAESVQKQMSEKYIVVPAMRYGKPSIEEGLKKLRDLQVHSICVLPLYPQYSLAATQSSVNEVKRVVKKLGIEQQISYLPAFYDHSDFVGAFKDVMLEVVREKKPEKVIFSFHGVPERHVKKTDDTGAHCLQSAHCCDKITAANKNCYRAQCFATARKLAGLLGLESKDFEVSFQSRLGRTPWIKPYTDILFTELAQKGVKRIAVVCPSFVADCLETLEEVAIRGRNDFIKAGGEELYFIPSLNSHPSWVRAVAYFITKGSPSTF